METDSSAPFPMKFKTVTKSRLQKEHFSALNEGHRLSPHRRGKCFIQILLNTMCSELEVLRQDRDGGICTQRPAKCGFSPDSSMTNLLDFCSITQISNLTLKQIIMKIISRNT